jgi:hypothetical protein
MRKGQTEIIGFMVIILLLFFGLIFYFKFAADTDSDLVGEAEINLEVSNMLNTIKKQTICEGETLGDAIKSCAGGGFACDESACDVVKREVPLIISLYDWEDDSYMFYIGEELYSQSTCKGNTIADDYSVEGIDVRLILCY